MLYICKPKVGFPFERVKEYPDFWVNAWADISTQFSGGSYFAKRFETSSWSSFLLQRLSVISANCLLMGRLFFSSSLKVAVNSFKSICVVMWCLCARASPIFAHKQVLNLVLGGAYRVFQILPRCLCLFFLRRGAIASEPFSILLTRGAM